MTDQTTSHLATVRGTVLSSFRSAVMDLWGDDGLQELRQYLPDATWQQTGDVPAMNVDWFPESYVADWYGALWNGPCRGSKQQFYRVLDRMLDLGFGRVQRVALRLATPQMVLQRSAALWRHDHSHGEVDVLLHDDAATVTLANHPYTEDSLSCIAVAEIYRYCLSLCRVDKVSARHFREPDGRLIVKLRWTR